MKTHRSNRGFTLYEIMIASIIFMLVLASLMSFFMQSLRGIYASEQRMNLATRIKGFSSELIVQASRSNQFVLFKSIDPADFDGPNAAQTDPASAGTNFADRQTIRVVSSVPLHPAGDFVVFVYYEIPKPILDPATSAPLAFHRITKLEGYYLRPTSAPGIGSLYKVVIDLMAAGGGGASTSSIEAILTANWNTVTADWKTANSWVTITNYMNLVRGLNVPEIVDGTTVTGATTARLFYMSDARNVIISGQNYSSNKPMKVTNDWRTYTDSFFFNITPRT